MSMVFSRLDTISECDYESAWNINLSISFYLNIQSLKSVHCQQWRVLVWNTQHNVNCGFYPRDAMLARVIGIATCLSVCLSFCPSVTSRYCVKKKKASVMISSPFGSGMILVFCCQILSPNSKGFPSNKGGVRKFSDFLALSVNISKTVSDTAKVNISDW